MHLLSIRINLDAIAHNTRLVRELLGPEVALRAVVKADGYGHDSVAAAQVMQENGADAFGVATLDEAENLVKAGISLPIMAWMWEGTYQNAARAVQLGVQLGVPSATHARAVARAAAHRPIDVYVMVETGMYRNGIDMDGYEEVLTILGAQPNITVKGLMSHLACADEPSNPANTRQGQEFEAFLQRGRALGFELPENHLCNSAGMFSRPDLRYQMVRPGAALYGLEPIPGVTHDLQPVMSLVGTVMEVKHIPAGEGVSYGLTWHAPADGQLAVIGAGYADGLHRRWQGAIEVCIGGYRYPQVGRVCMDQIIVDLGTNPHGVRTGDRGVIFGSGGMSANELAHRVGSINYEIVCAPMRRAKHDFYRQRRAETAVETQELGAEIGAHLRAGDVVILDGPLGAGKTTFTQGLARGMEVEGRVTSPTFVIAREHPATDPAKPTLIHVDAYRLLGEQATDPTAVPTTDPLGELDSLDLDSELDQAVVVAEWGGGLIEQLAGERTLLISIDRDTAVRENPASEARIITWQWL